jgi:hypothetical protein
MSDFRFPPAASERQSEEERAECRARYGRGRELARLVNAFNQTEHLTMAMSVWNARSPGDRLSESEIARYLSDQIYSRAPLDFVEHPERILSADQGRVVPPIAEIVRVDPTVRSFLNIGVYLGLLDFYLARRFPQLQFTGVDFWRDLEEANAPLAAANFRVVHGYPLDLIEAGAVAGDIALFFSTACRIKNAELRRYLRSLGARYLVVDEPVFALPTGEILDPDEVDPAASRPAMMYPVFAGDREGGYPPCLVHNYRAIVEEGGWRVLHVSKSLAPSRFQIVAAR